MWGVIDIVSAGSCEMAKRYGVIYVDGDNLEMVLINVIRRIVLSGIMIIFKLNINNLRND